MGHLDRLCLRCMNYCRALSAKGSSNFQFCSGSLEATLKPIDWKRVTGKDKWRAGLFISSSPLSSSSSMWNTFGYTEVFCWLAIKKLEQLRKWEINSRLKAKLTFSLIWLRQSLGQLKGKPDNNCVEIKRSSLLTLLKEQVYSLSF